MLFLHSKECWERSSHSCQELPEPGDYENDDGVIVDYDQYDQTLHVLMDDLVDKYKNIKGFTMEWSRIYRMIKDYAWPAGYDGLMDSSKVIYSIL